MTYCKHCDKEIEPVQKGNRYFCPDCKKFVNVNKEEDKEVHMAEISSGEKETKGKKKEQDMILEGTTKLLIAPKTIKYDAADLHMGEILINLGYAKDLNDLTRKNMKLAFSLMNMGAVGKQFNAMENQEPNPERTMKEIQQQEMMKAYIEGMRKGNQTDPLSMMMLMRMMDNKEQGKTNNNVMDKMLEIQMMKSVMGGQNSEMPALQREIAELKHSMQIQQMLNQQQQAQQTGQSSQQFMQQMEQIRSERDKSIKQAEIDAQKERDKNLQLVFDNRRIELENRLQAMEKEMRKGGGNLATSRIKEMKEEIAAIKEMSGMLGDREKGTGEMIMEGIGSVAGQVGPALTEFLRQKREQQIYQPPEPMRYPPGSTPPNLQSNPPQNPAPKEPSYRSEMTETEKRQADQMAEMYINKGKDE